MVESSLTLKFLCSYGGRILPRYPDGKLRYHGGETRLLSVHRSITFSELLVKLGQMCGTQVSLRCQLPTEDLDALVSITSDEDLENLIEEYVRDAAAPSSSTLKIRAFLSAPKTTKKSSSSPPSSASASASASNNGSTSPKSPFHPSLPPRCPTSDGGLYIRHATKPSVYPIIGEKAARKLPCNCVYQYRNHGYGNCGHAYVIHNGSHWQ